MPPYARGTSPLTGRRESLWAIIDQALYAATNFASLIVIARLADSAQLGAFTLAIASWTPLWLVTRSLIAEPFVIKTAGMEASRWRTEAALGSGALLFVSAPMMASLALVATILPVSETARPSIGMLATLLPMLLLQDFWRVVSFGRSNGAIALVSDVVWVAVQFSIFGIAATVGTFGASTAILGWGAGGIAGLLVAQTHYRIRPRLDRASLNWLRAVRGTGGWFGLARGAQAASLQLSFVAIGMFGGLTALGGLRGVFGLFGPLGIVLRGLEISMLAPMSHVVGNELLRLIRRRGLILALFGSAYSLAIVVASSYLLAVVYGPEYREFTGLVGPIAVVHFAIATSLSASVALRRLGAGMTVACLETGAAVLRTGLIVLLVSTADVRAATIGLAVVESGHAVVAWLLVTGRTTKPTQVSVVDPEPRPRPGSS